MTRIRWTIAGSLFGLALAAWSGVNRERHGPTDANSGTIDGAVRTLTQGVQDASDSVRDQLSSARSSVRNLGIEQQITTRLSQDKTFDADRIEVHVKDDGTAILKGLVEDEDSKDRAVELTRDTRGVTRVIDHLAVPPPARVIASTRGDDDPSTGSTSPR